MEISKYIEILLEGKILNERQCKILCEKAKEVLLEESNIHPIEAPVNICGDIHGQFYDLLKLFEIGGQVPNSRYLFLGDYVDRGNHSVETISYLLCLKVAYPDHIFLIRGNHESRMISMTYGFYTEIYKKYGNYNAFKYFNEAFDCLPLGAIVEGSIFGCHGGLSPEVSAIDQFRLLYRKCEIPNAGPISDLMWSDPDDKIETWTPSERGAGWYFGWKAVEQFNHINSLDLVVRAHQLAMDGFKYSYEKEILLTIWSAPNYYYRCGNRAAFLKVDKNLNKSFEVFGAHSKSTEENGIISDILPYFL